MARKQSDYLAALLSDDEPAETRSAGAEPVSAPAAAAAPAERVRGGTLLGRENALARVASGEVRQVTQLLLDPALRARMGEEAAPVPQDAGLDELVGKLGARLGAEAVTRFHPAESHAPERSYLVLAAAWSRPHAARIQTQR